MPYAVRLFNASESAIASVASCRNRANARALSSASERLKWVRLAGRDRGETRRFTEESDMGKYLVLNLGVLNAKRRQHLLSPTQNEGSRTLSEYGACVAANMHKVTASRYTTGRTFDSKRLAHECSSTPWEGRKGVAHLRFVFGGFHHAPAPAMSQAPTFYSGKTFPTDGR